MADASDKVVVNPRGGARGCGARDGRLPRHRSGNGSGRKLRSSAISSEVFNVFDGELDRSRDEPAGFRWRAARVGERLGGQMIGASVYELEPGEKTFPYHYEYGNEEWLLCVAGRPTLRAPEGEQELRPGDVVVFPEGPAGAHQVINATGEVVRVVIFSTMREPSVAIYPDSDKLGVWAGDERLLVRRSDGRDYWDGELPG